MVIKLIVCLIKFYQIVFSPWIGSVCRFSPSCSCYAQEALKEHGLIHGVLLIVCRLIRCQPFCCGGYDPVPQSVDKK